MSDVENEVEQNPLEGLVQAALDKDYNKANEIFGQAISVKMNDVLDQERVKVAGQIFNGEEPDEEGEEEEDIDTEDDVEEQDDEISSE